LTYGHDGTPAKTFQHKNNKCFAKKT